MTNLLLISSLVSLMSMSLEGVMAHAREEYLFQFVAPLSRLLIRSPTAINVLPIGYPFTS
jgi:hypothetical protein